MHGGMDIEHGASTVDLSAMQIGLLEPPEDKDKEE
jgi:hypothetical protein